MASKSPTGAANVVIDHVSIAGSVDGNLDITEGAHDVTVSWSILATPRSGRSMLVKYNAARVSLHHNLFVDSVSQNPDVSIDNISTAASDTTVDMRNNLIWNWGAHGFGTQIHRGARVNLVNNLYAAPDAPSADQSHAIIVCAGNCLWKPDSTAQAHASGNVSADG